ncbi:MAG: HEAT repeat domain-containing protein [Myxococcota bacterium]
MQASHVLKRFVALVLSAVCCVSVLATSARADDAAESARERGLAQTYRKMLAEDPYQDYALRRLLEVAHSVGGLPGLLASYRAEVTEDPQRAASWAVLGHLALAADLDGEALDAYSRAAALNPKAPEPWLATGRLHLRSREAERSLAAYDRAVSLGQGKSKKQEVLREAIQAALELRELDRADGYVAALIATEPKNAYLRMDYATALTQAGQPERALAAWLQSAQAVGQDLKLQVIIWRQVAELQEQLGDLDGAEATWRGALAKIPAGHWAREGYLDGLVGLYRRRDALRALVAELQPESRRDPAVRVVVARLLEEVGEDGQALELFRKVIEARPSDLESHERIISILERIGSADEVLEAWRALVRASGGEPRYELRLVERLFQRGRSKEAFASLTTMARRYPQDPGVHQSVIDLTMRYGDATARKRIEREYRVLMKLEPREQGHVISLGEFYWTGKDRAQAMTTWKRLLSMGKDAGEGHLLLAEVYADHGLVEEARTQFEAALAAGADSVRAAKTYALWLEGQEQHGEALRLWLQVEAAARGGSDGAGRRPADVGEARRHVIELWERAGRLASETERLKARFGAESPDLEAGRVLAKIYLRQRQLDDAQGVLERVVRAAPDDAEALAGLEEVYTRQNRLPEAIDVLERLARRNPRSAHEFYHRAADLALAQGDDAKALELARRAVAGNPADPKAHSRVGELYLRMGRTSEAAEALRQSLALDPRGYEVRFRLAGLYSELGQSLREEQVLVDIVRDSSDPGELLRAGRRLVQVAGHSGRLADVELALRPLLQGQGARHEIILKLLVDLYVSFASEIAWSPAPEAEREEASRRLGERALEPLLAALGGQDVALRARALQVIRQTQPRGAAPVLARLAGEADAMTSFQAAIALGQIGTVSAREALSRMLARPGSDGADVAIWSLGLTGDPEAAQALIPALTGGQPRARILAALALGFTGGAGVSEALAGLNTNAHAGVRVAVVWSLARLAEPAAIPALTRMLRSEEEALARCAAWGLGRIDTPESRAALAAALWDPATGSPALVGAALLARPARDPEGADARQAYIAMADVEHGQLNANAAGLLATARPAPVAPEALAAALAQRADLISARIAAIFTAGDSAALAALLKSARTAGADPATWGALRLLPLTPTTVPPDAAAVIAGWLAPHADSLAAAAAGERGPALRPDATDLLARIALRGGDDVRASARLAALAALADTGPNPALRVAGIRALALLATPNEPSATALIAAANDRLAAEHPAASPPERLALAAALGRLKSAAAADPLRVLLRDSDVAVRLAALAALPEPPPAALTDALIDLVADSAPSVALAALSALGRSLDPRARAAVAAATTSFNPSLRLRARALSP